MNMKDSPTYFSLIEVTSYFGFGQTDKIKQNPLLKGSHWRDCCRSIRQV